VVTSLTVLVTLTSAKLLLSIKAVPERVMLLVLVPATVAESLDMPARVGEVAWAS
jgi:hypothetical protein